MNTSLLAKQLELDEGRRKFVYMDTADNFTIGVGRNLTGVGLSDEEIDTLLHNDIYKVCRALDLHLPWWREMSEKRQHVLANMCFNLGITKLLAFKNTLTAMQQERYEDAAKGMLESLWAKQVHGRAQRLAKEMAEG